MGEIPRWLAGAVKRLGVECSKKLAGPGEAEAAIRTPLEHLLGAAGPELGVRAVFHDEVRDTERRVRPDYGVSVSGAITGYVEVKAPGKAVAPAALRGHDKVQWERQQDLPNLLYTNGTEWRLYQDGEHRRTVHFAGDLYDGKVTAPPEFEALLADFLVWKPAPIVSLGSLVTAIARMTRLLRGEVLDQLAAEHTAVRCGADERLQPFLSHTVPGPERWPARPGPGAADTCPRQRAAWPPTRSTRPRPRWWRGSSAGSAGAARTRLRRRPTGSPDAPGGPPQVSDVSRRRPRVPLPRGRCPRAGPVTVGSRRPDRGAPLRRLPSRLSPSAAECGVRHDAPVGAANSDAAGFRAASRCAGSWRSSRCRPGGRHRRCRRWWAR